MTSFLVAFLCGSIAQILLLFAFATDGKWISIFLLWGAIALWFV